MSTSQKPRVDEEEDLDDLDDVLDQFSSPAAPTSQPPSSTSPLPQSSSASSSKSPQKVIDGAGDELADEFAAELAKEMESLFKDLGIDPQAVAGGGAGGSETSTQNDFQSRIRSTVNKLKESESGLKSSDSAGSGTETEFEALLSQLGGLEGLAGEGEEGEEQLQGIMEAMMGQLLSKEVLYEPLKELHDKFPGYLTEHRSTISAEDKERYEAQIACIKRLLDEFEAKEYREEDEKARERIVELMSELQAHGSPPEEIMGPLPPGFTMGADGLPNLPPDCVIS